MDFQGFARFLILAGISVVFFGLALLLIPKFPLLGHLPGDVCIKYKNVQIIFPIVTCLLISLILTLIFNLFFK